MSQLIADGGLSGLSETEGWILSTIAFAVNACRPRHLRGAGGAVLANCFSPVAQKEADVLLVDVGVDGGIVVRRAFVPDSASPAAVTN